MPIISEGFSKLYIDTVATLPVSINSYLITEIYTASKYLNAIPVENITSVSAINALLQIFAKTDYPKK